VTLYVLSGSPFVPDNQANCRAEIGRLKSSAQSTSFRSPNRSILDESDDVSGTEGEEEGDDDMIVPDRVIDESDCIDSSFLRETDTSEVERLQSALDEANSVIQTLYAALDKCSGRDDTFSRTAAVPSIHGEQVFDDANFVTEWQELDPPLPGRPEHGLRSSIVAAVLEAWTSDANLHESLLSWVDDILGGASVDSVPPLAISSLDSEVRDGFVQHVLPLLLHRPDIHVDVKTRAQRRTSYDLSISVDDARERDSSRVIRGVRPPPEMSTDRVSSSAHPEFHDDEECAPLAKGSVLSRLSYDEIAEEIAATDESPPGIMSALGGAIGGLLTRRKTGVSNLETLSVHGPHGSMQTILESPASAGLAHEIVGLVSEADGGEQPYHRVVSAPPGRIGVTFVEYRGHCMVSDVSHDSPLIGWVFPSDVLIAIDDLPVSGMRVRDIIKVLKDRTSAQRALRVISSHAMNEFTLNASIMTDETE
jgi:hypothetical protein